LWGKEGDGDYKSQQSFPAQAEEKDCKTQYSNSRGSIKESSTELQLTDVEKCTY
jgi:hypothetical protein